jgi:hypothetical protein
MYPESDRINKVFGGSFPKAHNVFYSDFSDDPWQRASVDFSPSDDQPYFLAQCDNCGHCLDFHSSVQCDPEPIRQSRIEFEKYLVKWIGLEKSEYSK